MATATFRISEHNIKQEGESLVDFLCSEFSNFFVICENDYRVVEVLDARIPDGCDRIEILLSEEISASSTPNLYREKYKGKFYVWWEAVKSEPVSMYRNHTLPQLRYYLDFQLDQYNSHTHPFLKALVMLTIKDIGEQINLLEGNEKEVI